MRAGSTEHDAGLPLVGGDHGDRGAFRAEHQVVQAERGHQCGLALPARQHPASEGRGRVGVKDRADQLHLPRPQAERL
jgi:hypothetical protein